MKIIIYSSKFPPKIGGVEEVVKNLSIGLSKKNDVLVITDYNLRNISQGLMKKFSSGYKVHSKSNYEHINIENVFMSLPRSLFGIVSFPYRFLLSIFIMRRILSKFKPDILNAHFLDDSLFYFYISTLFKKLSIVLDIHGNELHLFSKNRFYRYFFQKIINKSSKIIVHSEFMRNTLNKMYKVTKPVVVIPNCIEISRFPKKSVKPSLDYYLYLGRLDYKKGIDVLIKAYKKAEKKLSRKLIIVGGSSGEKKHGSLSIEELKILAGDSKIEFIGRVENNIALNYFSNAFYSIFPSRFEPFGIVALESIACGTPFIASSGGFKEIAKNTGAGVIFKEGAVSKLANLLIKLDKDTAKRDFLSKKGLVEISKYDINVFLYQYLKELKKL